MIFHSALGRSSAKDAIAPSTASKAMAKKPEGGEVRLRLVERAAASPIEGRFRTLPEASVVDAFLAMSSNRELNRLVKDFIKNGEEGSASRNCLCGFAPPLMAVASSLRTYASS